MRVLVTGATGFIGGRLLEVMSLTGAFEPRAFIHSTASAARIARFPIDFVVGDLCDRAAVDGALRRCDAVVHLARGDAQVMRAGLENVLRAAVAHRVSRFVHMSSVAVYGNNPPAESVSEAAPARRTNMAYGNEKLAQEHRVLRYHRRYGLPVVILRPPNVYGPFSPFTLDVVHKIRTGAIATVDGGDNPCNLVYIDNLVQAVLLALAKPQAVGEIFFVTDSEAVSWRQCLEDHARLLGTSVPRLSAAELPPASPERVIRDSFRVLPRVLLSRELRSVLRQIPLVRLVERMLYHCFQSLSPRVQQQLRLWINGPLVVPVNGFCQRPFDRAAGLMTAQSRRVAHSSEKARRLLGYSAPISHREGMTLTEAWLRYSRII